MKLLHANACLWIAAGLSACGSQKVQLDRDWSTTSQINADQQVPNLGVSANDEVLETLVIDMGKSSNSFGLADANSESPTGWTIDMQSRQNITGAVAPEKYLRVKGVLTVPQTANDSTYDIGCLFVELKDNVLYRDRTWLRLGTTGIRGDSYKDVELPLLVNKGTWTEVPVLPKAITLSEFKQNSIKKFDGTMCFRLDFKGAPAQKYTGQIVVQYLKPAPTSVDPAPVPLVCDAKPMLLRAGQQAEFGWTSPAGLLLETSLALDPPRAGADMGRLENLDGNKVRYRAPTAISSKARVLVTAKAVNAQYVPGFCEITLMPDEEIVVEDDGETEGVVGNVYRLAVNQAAIPNFDTLVPVATVLAPNLDVANRPFSQGFPGVRDLFEWFGIRFVSTLKIPAGGVWEFNLTADDGAKLYIDGNLVVNNDGTHPVKSVVGTANLTKGDHKITVEYFQGPRYYIALQLASRLQGSGEFVLIPPAQFGRPLGPN